MIHRLIVLLTLPLLMAPSASSAATPMKAANPVAVVAACAGIVASTVLTDPLNSARGWGIMLMGVPVYWYWSSRRKAQ